MAREKRYCTILRSGTPDNPSWHRSGFMSRESADSLADRLRKQGEYVLVEDYDASLRMGLPEGWEIPGKKKSR